MSVNQQTRGSRFRESERTALITGYPDNHCLVTRYPDNRYETRNLTVQSLKSENLRNITYEFISEKCKTNPILSAVGGFQMNVSILLQMEYENKRNWTLGESKPNSNPIQTQTNPVLSAVEWANLPDAQMSVNSILTKDYEGNGIFAVPENKANSNPNKPCPERSRMGQSRNNSKACFSPPEFGDGLLIIYGFRKGVVIWQTAESPAPHVPVL